MKRRSSPGDRPRVLYLAFFFPPSRASGVYRALATANHLANSGWDVTVLTAPREFFTGRLGSSDPSLEARVDPRVTVSRAGLDTYRWRTDIRSYSWLRGNLPNVSRGIFEWRVRRGFPDAYASWIPRVVGRALRAHLRCRFDLVVATGNPFASFAAAWWLRRLAGLPYVLDYRDAWTLDLFTEEPKYPAGHVAWRWERRVVEGSSLAVFVNEGLRGWHAARYPGAADRMMVVPNGWEPELLGGGGFPGQVSGRPPRFGYLGTITEPQPLEQLFEGWRIARRHPDLAEATLDLYGHLGFFERTVSSIRRRLPLHAESGVRYRGPVAKAEIADAYRDIDVLVFMVAGARYVTSGKVFEYMATGKPIVSVHRPDIAAVEVLRGHPLWFPVERLDGESVANAMIGAAKAARDLTEEDFAAARRHAERYTRDATLRPLEKALRQCLPRDRESPPAVSFMRRLRSRPDG